MYNFIRKIKNVFVPLKETRLSDIKIEPGDIILVFKDGEPYGSCGAVSRYYKHKRTTQFEYKETPLIEHIK